MIQTKLLSDLRLAKFLDTSAKSFFDFFPHTCKFTNDITRDISVCDTKNPTDNAKPLRNFGKNADGGKMKGVPRRRRDAPRRRRDA